MSTKKVLLSCTVVALQDTCFLYPCCKFCLSRSSEESDLRSRCVKCGFTCDLQNVDYRYRLSIKVSRFRKIFVVTVFGGCLNPFFGITAGGLQRFLDSGKPGDPQSLQQLLLKAVEDCFIGKSFVFGFKLSGLDAESCLFDDHTSSIGSVAESKLVACQIIPNGTFRGMTVFAYLQSLLQANSLPSCSASHKAVSQSQQKDSLINSFDYTLPLCVRSYSETSIVGLTQLWQPKSDLDLCFSLEETSGHSLQMTTVDDDRCSILQYVSTSETEWPTKELSLLSQNPVVQVKSIDGVHYAADTLHTISTRSGTQNRHSDSLELSSTSPVALTSPNTMHCGHPPKTLVCKCWSSQKLPGTGNASCLKKSLFSNYGLNMIFALDDAPLSETLGSFVSIEPQITEVVNLGVVHPASMCNTSERDKATPKKTNCVLKPLLNIGSAFRERSLKRMLQKRSIQSVSTPCCLSPKVSQVPEDSGLDSYDSKDKVSNSLTKNPVNMAFRLQCDQRHNYSKNTIQVGHIVCPEFQNQCIKKQELPFDDEKDTYNCSEDLFYQSNVDVTIPDVTKRAVSERIKKDSLLDINPSECEVFSSFHFAPSLQSTPIANPCQRSYRQTLNRNPSDSPCFKKRMMHTTKTHSVTKQESKGVNLELNRNQIPDPIFGNSGDFENFRSSTALSGDVGHKSEDSVSNTNSNEWSKDLFTDSF